MCSIKLKCNGIVLSERECGLSRETEPKRHISKLLLVLTHRALCNRSSPVPDPWNCPMLCQLFLQWETRSSSTHVGDVTHGSCPAPILGTMGLLHGCHQEI